MAHPPPGGAIPADVREALVMVTVRRAERHLLDGLVHDEPLGLILHDPQAVPGHVQDGAHPPPPGVLKQQGGTVSMAGLRLAPLSRWGLGY